MIVLILVLLPLLIFGQGIVDLTSEGIVFPRYTTAQRNSLSAVKGQVIFNTTSNILNVYDGSVWQAHQGATPWITNGSNIHYSSGRVGVNAASPANQFHVVSDGAVSNLVRLDGGITVTSSI